MRALIGPAVRSAEGTVARTWAQLKRPRDSPSDKGACDTSQGQSLGHGRMRHVPGTVPRTPAKCDTSQLRSLRSTELSGKRACARCSAVPRARSSSGSRSASLPASRRSSTAARAARIARATLIVAAWLIESAVYAWFVKNVANYKTASGNLLLLVVVTTYLYISSIVFLVGAQLDEFLRRAVKGNEHVSFHERLSRII
jgi:hypothetical protein